MQNNINANERLKGAREALGVLSVLTTEQKNATLARLAALIEENRAEVLSRNAIDVSEAHKNELKSSFIDRLTLNKGTIDGIVTSIKQLITLPDPVGRVIEERRVDSNGLLVRKVSCPIGVIAIIYEARPNVTVDAFCLCFKAGNCCILKGGRDAKNTNTAFAALIEKAILETLGSELLGCFIHVATNNRDDIGSFLKQPELVDLVIPRGGKGLVRFVNDVSSVPVMKHLDGNCHVYIENSARLEGARKVLLNSKMRRLSLCNTTESLVIDLQFAEGHLVHLCQALKEAGCREIVGCEASCKIAPEYILQCNEEDFGAEFLDAKISVKVVNGFVEAAEHVSHYSSGHTEAILSEDTEAIRYFTQNVDSASIMVNASTQFADGFEFGLGCEIGISTGKLHARGPIGLNELNIYKYIVTGDYYVRA